MPRGLSAPFLEALLVGHLSPLLALAKGDPTLDMELREDALNLYFRGGSLIHVARRAGGFKVSFDANYFLGHALSAPSLPVTLNTPAEVAVWLGAVPQLKHAMCLWSGRHHRLEREAQQHMVRQNNRAPLGRATDYFICDIEYDSAFGRFDMIAARWPSRASERKKAGELRLALMELKVGDGALDGRAGLQKHLDDMGRFVSSGAVGALKVEMTTVFNQKRRLGLVDCGKDIEGFDDAPPDVLLVLADHDPDKSGLRKVLSGMKIPSGLRVKAVTANFMGYALFDEAILSLPDFEATFKASL